MPGSAGQITTVARCGAGPLPHNPHGGSVVSTGLSAEPRSSIFLNLMKHVILTSAVIFATLTARCAESSSPAATTGKPAPTLQPAEGFSGKVVETTNVAGYTYILVDTSAKKKWVAAPAFPVKVNDAVTITTAMAMPNYHSKTLNRDFDVVYFTGGVTVNGVQPKVPGEMSALPKDHPLVGHTGVTRPSTNASVDLSHITKAVGGLTVAEVFASKEKLSGKTATLRGRVVKFNADIMGKNWMHIRDGSGSEGSNDLLVTTAATAKVGDMVLVSGKVAINQDFGAGYKYSVLLADGKVTVE